MTTFAGAIQSSLEYWLGTDAPPYEFTIFTTSAKTEIRDITGYTLHFMVKRRPSDADIAAVISVAGVVSGVFNAVPAVNTQKLTVTLVDTDTDTEVAPGVAHWELKRTDAGAEHIMAYGPITLRRGVHIA